MKPLTILLIDDSETDRVTYRRFLSQQGQGAYHFVEFELASAALAWCQTHTPDVILLDYRLPDLDGLEFLTALQTQTGKTEFPLIMLTSYRDLDIAVEAMKRGAQDYLDKNRCSAAELQIRVQAVLERSHLKQTLMWQQERQRLVATTALRIRQSLSLPDILQTAVEEVRSLLTTDRVILYQFAPDRSGEVLVESVSAGWRSIVNEVIYDPCIENNWLEPFQQGRVVYHATIPSEGMADCYIQLMQRFQVQANLVIPVLQHNQLWGLLIAHQCSSPRQWRETDIELLQELAVQLAIAIEQAELHAHLQQEMISRQQSEIRFQKMFEQSPEGKVRFTPDGSVIDINRAWTEIWQAPREALTGYNILHDPVVASDGNLPDVLRAFAGETVSFSPFFHDPSQVGRPGRSRWVDMLLYPVKDAAEQILEVVMVVRDITDHIAAQQNQQQLIQLIENCPNFIGTATLEGQVTFVNPAGQALVGLEADQVGQTTIWDYQTVEESERLQSQILPTVLATGQWQGEFEMHNFQTGDRLPVWCNMFTITNPQTGQPGLLAVALQDLRSQQQTEKLLRQQEEKLRLLIKHAPVGIVMVDRDLCYITSSQRWLDDYGLGVAEAIVGRSLYELFPEIPERWRQSHQRCLAGATETTEEDLFIRADGSEEWVRGAIHPWYDNYGAIGGIVLFTENITSRKRAELALRESQNQVQRQLAEIETIYQSAHIGLAVLDRDLRFVRVNQRLADINGVSIAAHIGRVIREVVPDLAEIADQLIRPIFDTGMPLLNVEISGETPAQPGVKRVWLESFLPIREGSLSSGQSRITGINIVCEEITERKQAEISLQELNAELERRVTQRTAELALVNDCLLVTLAEQQQVQHEVEDLYDKAPCGYHSLDTEGTFIRINDTELNWLGYSRDEVIHKLKFTDVITVDSQLTFHTMFPQFKQRGWVNNLEFQMRHKEGSTRWVALNSIAIKDEAGNFVMSRSSVFDISERKQAEAVLLETERRWSSLLENVQLIVVGLDRFGTVNYINPFFLKLTGYTHSEVLGQNWFETCLPASLHATVQAKFIEALTSNIYPHYQNSILTKAGEERVIAWNNTRLHGPDGTVIGTISIGEDVTEQQKVERMKSEFLSVVSHELRTPLTSISGALELLSTGLLPFDSDRGRQSLQIAAVEADRLTRLVNDILDLERLEAGKLQLQIQPWNLADLMQRAIEFMVLMADQHQITLSVSPLSVRVNVDGDRILQVLTNLLNNAIKFSEPHQKIWLTAEVISPSDSAPNLIDSMVCLTVRDQGRGIPADKLITIFDRFQQIDASDARKKGGTGLGLAICYNIIQQHGGKIWAESTLGQGSEFRFTLPLVAPASP